MRMSAEFQIQEAVPAEAAELAALVNSAYRGDSSRLGWTTEADFLGGKRTDADDILSLIANPANRILVLREGASVAILACVLLEFFESEGKKGAYLGMLTVAPKLQDRGIGKHMMNECESRAQAWGAKSMVLGVIQLRESLMAWYERRGYKKTGLTKPFPYGNLRFGEPMRADLHFVFFEKSLIP
jgi:ribosomal protein S18 acetylase RimI-like enzyme